MNWNQPICEACWIVNEGVWVQHPDDEVPVLQSVRKPVLFREAGIEQCCVCGNPTIVGIYVRKDPTTVPFPKGETE